MKTATETTGDSSALIEAAVLAAVLGMPWTMAKVCELLGPEDFSNRANREMYLALLAMHRRGVPPDSVLLTAELVAAGKRSVVEMVPRLFQIGAVPAHLEFYLQAVLGRSKARRKAIELVESSNVIAQEPVWASRGG
jgi:replicative DNA helicase